MKDLLKNIYSCLVRLSSRLSQRQILKPRIAYLLSFPDNDAGLLAALAKEFPTTEITIFYTEKCRAEAKGYQSQGFKISPLDATINLFFRVIPWLSQASVIICDNYFAFLGDLKVNQKQQIYQIWHANGAIKTFGWGDEKTARRTQAEQARFQRVYNQFKQIVVGSEAMATVFKESYHLPNENILPLGLPRTDYYFAPSTQAAVKAKLAEKFPALLTKKVVLYVPTYRDQVDFEMLDVTDLSQRLGDEYLVLSKFHPQTLASVSSEIARNSDLKGLKLNELLFQVDYLITDYSSIPFEYGLANPKGRVLFYSQDLEAYTATTGLQKRYKKWLATQAKTTISQVVESIQTHEGLPVAEINQVWNQYNDGQATKRLLAEIKKHLGKE